MTFYNAELPGLVSRGSEAAPATVVDIARGVNGHEQRRARRSRPLRRFSIGHNLRDLDHLYEILSFFEVMNGPEHSFVIQNELDYKSCAPLQTITDTDAAIGTGDGSTGSDGTASFQLKKQYKVTQVDASVLTVDWTVTLPVQGTVKVAVDGAEKTEGVHFNVDYLTGIVTFTAGNIPTAGQAITAGFEFRLKVRFDAQDLSGAIETFQTGSVPTIPLIEAPNG